MLYFAMISENRSSISYQPDPEIKADTKQLEELLYSNLSLQKCYDSMKAESAAWEKFPLA